METAKPLPPNPPGRANGVLHRTKGDFARAGLLLVAVLPLGLPGLMHGNAPVASAVPANPETPYFKTGVLTLEDRIWAQTQIERVFYNHRIWPKENPGPKPPFETMVPRAVIEAKVTDSLKKSAALDKYWQHPVTDEMLQAELDRMAKQTRDPATLKELIAALHNDPRLIAETLARETLSDRLIRNWYAYDTRLHAEARAKAEAIAARITNDPRSDWKTLGGDYHHQVILLYAHPDHVSEPGQNPDEHYVNAEEFTALKRKYSHQSSEKSQTSFAAAGVTFRPALGPHDERGLMDGPGAPQRAIPTADHAARTVSDSTFRLEANSDAFQLTMMLADGAERMEMAAIVLPKHRFEAWWAGFALEVSDSSFAVPRVAGTWRLPATIATEGCDSWSSSPNLIGLPSAAAGHTAIWTGSEMIIWGAPNSSGFLNTGSRYNPVTDSWLPTSMGANLPIGRYFHTAIWTGSEMIVWGGVNNSGNLSSGGRYNPVTDSWLATSTASNLPSARYRHISVWTGAEMIVWGGIGGTYLNSGGRYNPNSDYWLSISSGANLPAAREFHTAVWTGSEMIVWGGYNNIAYLNSGGRYNPTMDSWLPTSLGANLPLARESHTAIWTGTEMIVWGGDNGAPNYMNSGGRYNPNSDSWLPTSMGTNLPAAHTSHTAVWTGSEMIVWGGGNSSGYLNTGGRYNPTTDNWLPTSSGTNLPAARFLHTAVWTGSEMIIWGGDNGDHLNSGGRYIPATDSWLPTPTGANLPVARYLHTTVWTGSEMIVWGGDNFAPSHLNSGGRYNPATDSWLPTSVGANVPAERQNHTAVWTGSEMIVWGGYGSDYLNSGGRYNPATDSWLSISTSANLPAARHLHTVVWTGSEMIVWGGYNNIAYLNSGARYNPTLDSWLPTSLGANLPLARESHTAIWTGSEMIIWGGFGGAYLNSGGRYNPTTDSWLPTSTGVNLPASRWVHTAVWTGSEMIVWGGLNNIGLFNSGGRYNSTTDSWLPISTGSNLPIARYFHAAVWTGSEMIVWGGYNNVANLNSGGRYNPTMDSWLTTSASINIPAGRQSHSAIWTGAEIIVWGGRNNVAYLNSGGIYASGSVPSPGNTLRGSHSSYINLNWSTISGAGSYNVKRCYADTGPCIPGTTVSTPTINQYSEPDDGVSHFYTVEAVNQCGATP